MPGRDANTWDDNQVGAWLSTHRQGFTLPGPLYSDDAAHRSDLRHIWYTEWIFAGHEAEVSRPGDFLTLQIGDQPVMVVRGRDGELRALHNVCRHRGARICDPETGSVRRRLTCPYHQWVYELDGALTWGGTLPEGVTPSELSLGTAHCTTIGGLIFVCLAANAPDPQPIRTLLDPYLSPYGLTSAHVAHSETLTERGNWKLVMENNRECFHCPGSHPELCATFPDAPLHSGGGTLEEMAATLAVIDRCEAAGLPSAYAAAPDHSYRAMRMAFVNDAASMTRDGRPAVVPGFPGLPEGNIGDVLVYVYPSMWMHVMGDHAVTFRMLPTSARTTDLRTSWLVPGGAVEGVNYDLTRLTEVWQITNTQDSELVARAQVGVTSPAFRPGPYSPVQEDGVSQFVDWYVGRMRHRLHHEPDQAQHPIQDTGSGLQEMA